MLFHTFELPFPVPFYDQTVTSHKATEKYLRSFVKKLPKYNILLVCTKRCKESYAGLCYYAKGALNNKK